MELSIKFTDQELKLLWTALNYGIIHNTNTQQSNEMSKIQVKIEMIGTINKNK